MATNEPARCVLRNPWAFLTPNSPMPGGHGPGGSDPVLEGLAKLIGDGAAASSLPVLLPACNLSWVVFGSGGCGRNVWLSCSLCIAE